MTFKEKIDKILSINKLKIDSPSGLEQFLGVGVGSILKNYRNNQMPGRKVEKIIKEKLGINSKWWETGEGDIFTADGNADSGGVNEDGAQYGEKKRTMEWMEKVIHLQEKMLADAEAEMDRLRRELEECRREKAKMRG